MARRSALRASDADRERVADRLRQATAEGRLLAEELEERLGAAFSARTYGQLDAIVSDLPGAPSGRRQRPYPIAQITIASVLLLVFVMPVLVAVLVAALFVLATVLTSWGLLIAVAVLLFRSRRCRGWERRARPPYAARAGRRRSALL